MNRMPDDWIIDWDRIKTVYEPSDEPCAHWKCPYKHCVYHKFYNPDRESTINTPITIRELDVCMNSLDV